MKLVCVFLATILICQTAVANCERSSASIRKCYDNSPPEVVFKLFVSHLFSDSHEDEDYRMGSHYVEAGLTAKMNSDDVIQYFVERYLDIEKEVEDTSKRTLCLDGKPRYEGAESFVIFNQLDEVALNIYQKHLYIARSDLFASGLFDLDKALEEFPGSFTTLFMDHEVTRGGSEKNILEAAIALCKNPWGHSFQSSRNVTVD